MNPTVLVEEDPAVRSRPTAPQGVVVGARRQSKLEAVVTDGPEASTADLDELLRVVGSAEDLSSGIAVGTRLLIMLGDLHHDWGPDLSIHSQPIATRPPAHSTPGPDKPSNG